MQRRADPDARLDHHLGQLGVKAHLVIRVEEFGVLHQIDARLDGPHHRFLGPAVGRGQAMKLVRFVDGGVQLGRGVGGQAGNRAYRAAAGGHNLDIVGPFMHQAAHGAAQFCLAIGDLVAHMEVTAGAGDRPAAD